MESGDIKNSTLFAGSQASFAWLLDNMKTGLGGGREETRKYGDGGFLKKVQRHFGFLLLLKRIFWKFELSLSLKRLV